MKKVFLLFVSLFTINSFADVNDAYLNTYKIIKNSMLRGESIGTGFNTDKYIVTNRHVVKGYDLIRVRNIHGETVKAKVLDISDKYDLALIEKVSDTSLKLCDNSDIHIGNEVYNVGNPKNVEFIYTTGYISGFKRDIPYFKTDSKFLTHNLVGTQGQSGGALMYNDCVVGVITGITKNSYIGYSIPVETLKKYISEYESKLTIDKK